MNAGSYDDGNASIAIGEFVSIPPWTRSIPDATHCNGYFPPRCGYLRTSCQCLGCILEGLQATPRHHAYVARALLSLDLDASSPSKMPLKVGLLGVTWLKRKSENLTDSHSARLFCTTRVIWITILLMGIRGPAYPRYQNSKPLDIAHH